MCVVRCGESDSMMGRDKQAKLIFEYTLGEIDNY